MHQPHGQLGNEPALLRPLCHRRQRNIRTIEELFDVRLCATIRHLEDPAGKVYMLGMEGEFLNWTLRPSSPSLGNLCQPLGVPEGHWPHFKAGYTRFGQVVVANNTYDMRDFEGPDPAGAWPSGTAGTGPFSKRPPSTR